MGAQSDYASSKNLKITAPNSYPRYNTLFGAIFVLGPTPKTDRKVARIEIPKSAEFQFVNRIAYAQNRCNPTQPSAKAWKIGRNSYLARMNRWPEERD
ncbi:Ankyrin repeat family protein [Prunus dulcis]|uniref:Ankyrin repeat family protein n=1 Tax=Prunus dulcis TaxID=3755 RepID=A0A4Y1QVL1_PRUDU|nr:Ankyrin repeat family protein [Prunus dulcis]